MKLKSATEIKQFFIRQCQENLYSLLICLAFLFIPWQWNYQGDIVLALSIHPTFHLFEVNFGAISWQIMTGFRNFHYQKKEMYPSPLISYALNIHNIFSFRAILLRCFNQVICFLRWRISIFNKFACYLFILFWHFCYHLQFLYLTLVLLGSQNWLASATNIEPGKPAHMCSLTRLYTTGWPVANSHFGILKIVNRKL